MTETVELDDFITTEEYTFLALKHGGLEQLADAFHDSLEFGDQIAYHLMNVNQQEELMLDFFIKELYNES